MIVRRIFNSSYIRHQNVSKVKFGEKGSIPIDQSPSQEFNIDPNTGRPLSDIQRLTRLQDSQAMQSLFASLPEFKSNFLPADISNEDALRYMCPRLCQLPSELLDYKEGLAKYELSLQEDAKRKELAEQQAKSDEEFVNQFKESLTPKS